MQGELEIAIKNGSSTGKMQASLRLMKPNYAHVRMTGMGGQLVVSDGKTVFRVEESQKQYEKSPADPAGVKLFIGSDEVTDPIAAFFFAAKLASGGKHRYAGARKVNGKTYQVVQFTAREAPRQRILFFGASGLLEGMELKDTENGQTQTVSFWFKNLQLNAPMKPEQFAYAPPEGFEIERTPEESLLAVGQAAPDFNLPQPAGARLSLSDARQGKKAVLVNFWFYG